MPDPKLMVDGLTSASAGMDSSKPPSQASIANPDGLDPNQVSFAVNCTMRGGKLKPRPGYRRIALDLTHVSYPTARFQGGEFYDPGSGRPGLVASIGGRQFQYNVHTGLVTEITVPNDPNAGNVDRAYFLQAENFLIIQDGKAKPIIFDGASSKRSDFTIDQIPTGTVMAYAMGRVAVTLPDGQNYRIGDLYGSTPADGAASILLFTENTFLNEGGDFSTSFASLGPITAMKPVALPDNSIGQGPLVVFTSNGAFSVTLPFDRTIWKELQNPIQSVALLSFGAVGPDSVQQVNSDLFYRAKDGIRSLILAQRLYGGWINTPISKEMNRVLDFDDQTLISFCSAVNFDNRYLMTCSPYRTAYGIAHRGLIALDFDLVSTMRLKLPPAYDGVWEGPKILKVIKGEFGGIDRCFMFTLEDDNTVGLWEITTGDINDNQTDRIQWWFETAAFPYGYPFTLKRLDSADMWIDQLQGTVDFTARFRPDRYPAWRDWQTWQECAKIRNCDSGCINPPVMQPQFRPRMVLKKPSDACDPITNRPFTDGYEHQLRIEVTGYCEIMQLRVRAYEREETTYGPCLTSNAPCPSIDQCPGMDFN